jgi:hypothetical protein
MKKWVHKLNREFSRYTKEMFNFSGYKRDANQNNT